MVSEMKRGRRPGALSLRLEAMGVGDREMVTHTKDRIRATIQGRATRMNSQHPERRFLLDYVDGARTVVTRLEDRPAPESGWAVVWSAAMKGAGAAGYVTGTCRTHVPITHGFAVWALEVGLGGLVDGWWIWEHAGGWKEQRVAERVLRKHGVPARTWVDRSKTSSSPNPP